ncbi:unnamed protein product, partial [Musa acuminata subsp. burmannicoides]
SIHPRLGEVRGGRQSIAGSMHNSLYHFWQRFTTPFTISGKGSQLPLPFLAKV